MTINLSDCYDENEVVYKTLSNTSAVQCEMVNTDILRPILKLNSSFIEKNYAHIPSFGNRYYFIRTVETIAGGHCLIYCEIDVLMTYKAYLNNIDVYVSRNEFDGNNLIPDNNIVLSSDKRIVVRKFGEPMTNISSEFLIGVIGSSPSLAPQV